MEVPAAPAARRFAGVPTERLEEAVRAADEILAAVLGIDAATPAAPPSVTAAPPSPEMQALRASDDDLRAIEETIVAAIDDEWSGRIPDAVDAALDELAAGAESGLFTAADLAKVLEVIGVVMAASFGAKVVDAVREGIESAYGLGRSFVFAGVTISVQSIGWSVVDEHACRVLADDVMFWVGDAWNRTLGKQIADVIREVVIEQGLGRKAAGVKLEEILGTIFPERSRAYWDVVASAGTVRARTFGAVESFVQAEGETYEWVATLDARTCPICAEMDGRTFTVRRAVEIRDAFLAAENPEAAKAAHPWAKLADVAGKSTADLEAAGFVLPPLHGNDRCQVVISKFIGE